MKRTILLIMFSTILLCGCNTYESLGDEEPSNEVLDANGYSHDSYDEDNYESLKLKADILIENLITGIEENDVDKIQLCLNKTMIRYNSLDMSKFALRCYRSYFNYPKQLNIKYLGYSKNDLHPDNDLIKFVYVIYNEGFHIKKVHAYVNAKNSYIGDRVLYNSYPAYELVRRFVEGLKEEDVTKVSSNLSVDIICFPKSEAKKVINEYNSKFDIETLKYYLVEIDDGDRELIFKFKLEDDYKKYHYIKVKCSEGLFKIENNLGPSLDEVGKEM